MNCKPQTWLVRIVTVSMITMFVSVAGAQTTWHVDVANDCPGSGSKMDPFCAVQAAIDAAKDGDEILVAPGTYNEAINFGGKAIHLMSSHGPDVTIIDASGLDTSVVTCASGEGPDTIIEGFTLTGGNAGEGGGMRNLFASPTVTNCIFIGNTASFGAAIANNTDSNPTVTNCHFENNFATGSGGGVYNVNFSTATVIDSTFAGNSASSGGAIFNSGSTFCNSHVAGSLFCENIPDDIFGTWHNEGGNTFPDECPTDCPPTDLNCDGAVDVFDLLILLSGWGKCSDPADCPPDLNGDGVVDVFDLLILLSNWS